MNRPVRTITRKSIVGRVVSRTVDWRWQTRRRGDLQCCTLPLCARCRKIDDMDFVWSATWYLVRRHYENKNIIEDLFFMFLRYRVYSLPQSHISFNPISPCELLCILNHLIFFFTRILWILYLFDCLSAFSMPKVLRIRWVPPKERSQCIHVR